MHAWRWKAYRKERSERRSAGGEIGGRKWMIEKWRIVLSFETANVRTTTTTFVAHFLSFHIFFNIYTRSRKQQL